MTQPAHADVARDETQPPTRQATTPSPATTEPDERRSDHETPNTLTTFDDVLMSNDIATFLRARMDEEAELANRCDSDGRRRWIAHGHTVDFGQVGLSGFDPAIAEHVALHAPDRVLRQITARRRILARHTLSPAVGDPELPWDNRNDCQYDGEDWPCADLLDLALPYAEHPDYRNEWLPEYIRES